MRTGTPSEDELKQLFADLPDPYFTYYKHDMAPPLSSSAPQQEAS